MHGLDRDRLEKLAEGLALAFYVTMFMALVMALAGATGSAFLLLFIGSCAHVGRAGLEEFVERGQALPRRSRPEPQAQPAPADERQRPARRVAA